MTRIDRLKNHLAKEDMLPFVAFDLLNIKYLSEFDGSNAYLVIGEDEVYLISDSRYEEYAKELLADGAISFHLQKESFADALYELICKHGWNKLYLEDEALMWSNARHLQERFSDLAVHAGGNPTKELRVTKEAGEIAQIKKSAEITDACFSFLCDNIEYGMSEWDISVMIHNYYLVNGCSGLAFEPIVALGANASKPHHKTSKTRRVTKGDTLLIDMGGVYEGYNSDLTRTIFIGYVDEKMREIYDVVNVARKMAVEALAPGKTTGEIDAIARGIISEAGYASYFGHSLGHGVGLNVHEHPRVKANDETVLEAGAVVTIEPGIYIPGSGGVRIEDLVLLTEYGYQLLSHSFRDIFVL